jgi:hypothetical protein
LRFEVANGNVLSCRRNVSQHESRRLTPWS